MAAMQTGTIKTYSGDIAAGTTVVVDITEGLGVNIILAFENTGANDIDAIVVQKSPDGKFFGGNDALGTAMTPLKPGTTNKQTVEEIECAFWTIRFKLGSTLGASYKIVVRRV